MNPMEFAYRHLHPYKEKGDEIIPVYCPFCGGGPKKEKYKFAMNRNTGTYNCKRFNECGVKGSFYELCKHFREEPDRMDRHQYNDNPVKKKVYVKPQVKTVPVQSAVEKYLTTRGFSKATWERRGVAEKDGAIAMPYYQNGELVLMKYRAATKPTKHWREVDGKPVFWGMDFCDHGKPLIITEGEMDALALDECGIENVVSVPSGAGDLDCIELCWDWLEKFNKVILWGDNDQVGQEMTKKFILRLGAWRCALVKSPHKDANVHLFKEGQESVRKAVAEAQDVPVAGIKRVADVSRKDLSQIPKVLSCIPEINHTLGGYRMGEMSIWSGINSAGKSTLLGQEIIEAIDQGFSVFAYSGELSDWLFKDWIHTQMCGKKHLRMEWNLVMEREIGKVPSEIAEYMEDWYKDQFYLYDSNNMEESQLLETCEIAARKYDCRVFLLDNLMSGLGGVSADGYYRAQSDFLRRVQKFCKNFKVHVHVVAHPRKVGLNKITKMDISGSADITNMADNVLAVHRFSERDKLDPEWEADYKGCAGLVQIFKSRMYTTQDVEIGVAFDTDCKRFYSIQDDLGAGRDYGWVQYLGEQSTKQKLEMWDDIARKG